MSDDDAADAMTIIAIISGVVIVIVLCLIAQIVLMQNP